jgi:hypothetical protein
MSLCCPEVTTDVVIVTTFWGRGLDDVAERREAELKESFWADMLARGCRVERFQNTYQSAWSAIGSLDKPWGHAENDRRAQDVEQQTEQIEARLFQSNNLNDQKKAISIIGWIRSIFKM